MRDNLFDSRQLNAWSFFSCQLAAGNYALVCAEAPRLSGALVVAKGGTPGPDFPSIVFTSGEHGELEFAVAPPFAATDATYITFSYSSAMRVDGVTFSVQISGAGNVDSRTLTTGQLVGYCFQAAGSYTYKGYLLVPPPPGSPAPPTYVLKQQGEITVRDNAAPGDPAIVTLDGASTPPTPVETPTGYPVSWEVVDGSWYLLIVATPAEENH